MAKIISYNDGMASEMLSQIIMDLCLTNAEIEYKHLVSSHDGNYTICGIAYIHQYTETGEFKEGKVTCPDCVAIINYVKKLKKGIDY